MRKDVYHMIDWLKAHADVEEIDYETSFSKTFRHFEPMNVSNSIANMKLRIPPEEYQFIAFKLLDTERNREYNKDVEECHMPFAFVIFELKTGYFNSWSAKLSLEMAIEQGVDENAGKDSVEYQHYDFCLKSYNAHEY